MISDPHSQAGRCRECGRWLQTTDGWFGRCIADDCSLQGQWQPIDDGRARHSALLEIVTRRLKAAFEGER